MKCNYIFIIITEKHLFLSPYSLTEIKEIPGQISQRLPSNKEKASPIANISISIYKIQFYS